jgi:hypothetical protein
VDIPIDGKIIQKKQKCNQYMSIYERRKYVIPFAEQSGIYKSLSSKEKHSTKLLWMDTQISDNSTKPPPESSVHQSGHPSMRRNEKHNISKITLMCSNCRCSGHTKKQCTKPIVFLFTLEDNGISQTDNRSSVEITDTNDSSAMNNMQSNNANSIGIVERFNQTITVNNVFTSIHTEINNTEANSMREFENYSL